MNTKIRLTPLTIIIATAALGCGQAAFAEDDNAGHNMRFNFPPHYYRLEQSALPPDGHSDAPAAVQSGKVPHNLLGVDPNFIKPVPRVIPVPAPAPVPVTRVAAKPSVHFVPSPFQAVFGNPNQAQAPLIAHNNPPLCVPPAAPAKPKAAHPAASRNVAGKLLKRPAVASRAAVPATLPNSNVASYGNQFYLPGANLPGAGGASAEVHGRIMSAH